MGVTIHDVAKLAGVNSSTVSRVLNGKASVMPETREKIYSAMHELDYHPNSLARCLANGLSGAIGVVVDAEDAEAFSNVFFTRSLFAIERVAQEYDYHVILLNGAKQAGGTGSIERLVLEKKVDGLIIPPSTIRPSLLKNLLSFPCVVLGRPDNDSRSLNWVDINNEQGSEMAVLHLLKKHYRKIAYFGGNVRNGFTKHRISGYQQALDKQEPLVISVSESLEAAEKAALDLLSKEDRPDAFLCNDNISALGVLKAAKALTIDMPDQLGIVTFDNYPLAEYTDPPLTSVDVDTAFLGEQTARLLFQQIHHPSPCRQTMLGVKLLERASTQKGSHS